ncbi:MAG: ATP-binding protein [Fulvivirga sp.]|nr:ATP-binding protein [Fulvivirga sp.]
MSLLNNFKFNVVVRILLIVICALGLSWIILSTSWFFTPLVISVVLILLVISLIYYVDRTNQNLTQFLLSIKQGGFTTLFKNNDSGGSHGKLNAVFNEVLQEFQKVSIEKESHYQYLQTMNENLGIALLSFDEEGKIELMNPAAKSLLNKPYLNHIDDLKHINEEIHQVISELESMEKRVIKTVSGGELLQLSVQAKDFLAQDKKFRLVLMQNIHSELEEKEVEAWQKLISVLTHEIMNSVTPIASLSTAMNQQLQVQETISRSDAEELKVSLATIEKRSKGLMRFINAYKDFTKQPDLSISELNLKTLIERIINLLSPDLKKHQIRFSFESTAGNYKIKVDPELIEQVIINLIKNAIEVLENHDNAMIKLKLEKAGRHVLLRISDNGPGIDDENLEKIFVPFFTTKKKGTGVGLSFARQIMRLHNGSITVSSRQGKGTTFTLEF